LGKLYRVSQPYAPGATPVWTTYAYDGSGRTLSVTAPDGSVTRYAYAGNQTTVTDPAGNWKTTTTDALGNLISVTEPNPADGANFVTTYAYDAFNHLTNVTMTRPEGTQIRTFQYNGLDLVSATNPENGTVTYTYDASHKVLARTDAKNQQTQYTYDQYGRVAQVLHGGISSGMFTADPNQTWTFAYDTNIRLSSQNTSGRLAAVTVGSSQIYGPGITYEYNYSRGGEVFSEKIHVEQILPQAIDINLGYTWDVDGRLVQLSDSLVNYGSQTYGYEYQYDSMGRLNTLLGVTCLNGCTSTIATATYGPANEMTSLSYGDYNETRTYNNLLQLTRQTIPGVFDTEYVFPTGLNNGRISSSIDHITGDQVNYTYDALERLTHAETVSSAWGQTYAFDGFGNLTAKTVTKGSGSNWAQAYDPATNRMLGNPLITYDPNGNIIDGNLHQTYDVENRVKTETIDIGPTSSPTWYYDASGKRVVEIETLPDSTQQWTLYVYDIFGHVYSTLTGNWNSINVPTRNVYFGNRLIQSNGTTVVTDRLGSVRANSNGETFSYLPYGEERTPTANARIKFGTYTRDSTTYNQDYADQRYYNPWFGRFNTPDPNGTGAADPNTPATFNRYAYISGDPVNNSDPTGLGPGFPTFTPHSCPVPDGEGFVQTLCELVSIPRPRGPLPLDPPTLRCLPDPKLPSGISNTELQKNISEAQSFLSQELVDHVDNPIGGLFGFLTAKFQPGGDWDYKKNYAKGTADYQTAQDFGNFDFGAVLESLGFSYSFTQTAAGIAQIGICMAGGGCGKGIPFMQYPYGDQPGDAAVIKKGWDYQSRLDGGCN